MSTAAPVQGTQSGTQNNGDLFHILSPEDLIRQRLETERKRLEHEEQAADWKRKAELAVRKGDDGLAEYRATRNARSIDGLPGYPEPRVVDRA